MEGFRDGCEDSDEMTFDCQRIAHFRGLGKFIVSGNRWQKIFEVQSTLCCVRPVAGVDDAAGCAGRALDQHRTMTGNERCPIILDEVGCVAVAAAGIFVVESNAIRCIHGAISHLSQAHAVVGVLEIAGRVNIVEAVQLSE